MTRLFSFLVLALTIASPAFAQLQEFSLKEPCPGVKEMWFSYSMPPKKPVAAFVTLKSYSVKKDRPLPGKDEKQSIQDMAAAANENGLLFVQVEINATSLSADRKKEDYAPKRSFTPIVVSNIQRLGGNSLPLCLYSRGAGSTGLLMEICDTDPRNVAAWCFDNAVLTAEFSKLFRAPGIMICNNDHVQKDKIRDYFDNGRKENRNWTWLEIKPIDSSKLLPFVSKYFSAASLKPAGLWFDSTSLTQVVEDLINTRSPKLSWMPDSDIAASWVELQNTRSEVPTVIEDFAQPNDKELAPIKFYLRLPPGAKDGSSLSGMIAYCTWVQDRNQLMQQLLFDPNRPEKDSKMTAIQMLKFAEKNNLGVLTWSTPGKWNAAQNTEELGTKEAFVADRLFDTYAEAWDRGVTEFVRKYKIPADDYLLYGFSRGAQWAHRLALRKPERFLAVNIHVNSSYDKPTPDASQCLWLVTTGDREHGYESAKKFYAECQTLNYPIIFKAEEALGHSSCKEVEALRDQFFDYALQVKRERNSGGISKPKMAAILTERLKQSMFIGDYLNQQLFPAEEANFVSPKMRVYLPTQQLAEAWITKYMPEK